MMSPLPATVKKQKAKVTSQDPFHEVTISEQEHLNDDEDDESVAGHGEEAEGKSDVTRSVQ
jgi:hypothetical protein